MANVGHFVEFSHLDESDLGLFTKGHDLYMPFCSAEADKWSRDAGRTIAQKIRQRDYCARMGINVSDLQAF